MSREKKIYEFYIITSNGYKWRRLESISFFIPTVFIFIPLLIIFFYKKSKTKSNITQDQNPIISVGDWLINFLTGIIPFVGIIFMIIWANDDSNKSRKNWAIASLIWYGIILAFSIFIYAIVFATIIKRF
jgi:hypothetical protein